jgi:uncharacterized spore protein YtfJ
MNNPVELLRALAERLQTSASVKNVFGDPITVGDKTVIPVARIGYGLGAGAGGIRDGESTGPDGPIRKGGGGGGVGVEPAGVLEITPAGTRFIAFADPKRLAAAVAGGFLLGMILGWRRSGSNR